MGVDVSIIISERGEPANLIWTLQGIEQEFSKADFTYEYIIVVNGDETDDPTLRNEDGTHRTHGYAWLKKKWPWISGYGHMMYRTPGGIYQARNLGASRAAGRLLWFLDAHTLPVPGDYIKFIHRYDEFPPSVWHMGLKYFLDKPKRVVFGYRWKSDMFWGSWTRTPPVPPEYRILMNGGANILMHRDIWFEIGGYNPGHGIYGGGEPYTDIKAQMYGYRVRSTPDLHYYHLAIQRGYFWFQTDMWKNFMITSYALGGPKYFDKVYSSYYSKCVGHPDWMKTLDDARDEALKWAIPDWEKTSREAKFTVDEVLADWREYALANKFMDEAVVE
jgi:glycosyltransferase involved in cell wall biosynthesis